MNKTILPLRFAFILVFATGNIFAQKQQQFQTQSIHWKAHKIEKIKDSDCIIISYPLIEYNATPTSRDDKDLGVFYFVSGSTCSEIFTQTFAVSPYKEERLNPVTNSNLDMTSWSGINALISHIKIGEGSTKLYLTRFFSDKNTPDDPRDDEYLGIDYVIDSGDPESIVMPFELEIVKAQLENEPELFQLLSANSYYALREMIINEKLVVEKLRSDKKLKDITPKEPKMTNERMKALLSMH